MVSERLLACLRERLGGGIDFAAPPTPLSGGFDTTVLWFRLKGAPAAWSGDLVLRVMSFAASARRVRREAATHAALVAAGFPAPRILLAETDGEVLGRPFLIMERLPGETMWAAIVGPQGRLARLPAMPRQLGEVHARLHGIPGEALLESARQFEVDPELLTLGGEVRRIRTRIEQAGVTGLLPGATWLERNMPPPAQPEVICHGDFHPLNVMVQGDQVTGVIDWAQAIAAEPAFDVAASRVLGRFANLSRSAWARGLLGLARLLMLRQYALAYRVRRPLDARNMPYFEAVRVLSALTFAGERPGPGNPWGVPHVRVALYRHFEDITGVHVRL
jgi:aminoglycoside phosphotransferase (APT) family kinase protein